MQPWFALPPCPIPFQSGELHHCLSFRHVPCLPVSSRACPLMSLNLCYSPSSHIQLLPNMPFLGFFIIFLFCFLFLLSYQKQQERSTSQSQSANQYILPSKEKEKRIKAGQDDFRFSGTFSSQSDTQKFIHCYQSYFMVSFT